MNSFAKYYTEQIENDLLWRETELAILRKQLFSTTKGSTQERVFLRTNLAMIYAHYEGFCKFALGVYIDALEKLPLKRIDLKWTIAAQSLRQFHNELRNINEPGEYFTKIFQEMETHLNARPNYERPDNIANLWPDLLADWQTRLGLQSENVVNEKIHLKGLVNSRNQIAHGKNLTIANRSELDKHANAATLAMHEVAISITEALENRSYMRNGKNTTTLSHSIT